MTENLEIPAGQSAFIEVLIEIPEGLYAAHQEEYFGIDIIEKEGIRAGKTIYPATGIMTEYGDLVYKDVVFLQKEIIVDKNAKLGLRELEIYVMYQLCLETGACLMPVDEEHVVNIQVVKGLPQSKEKTNEASQNTLKSILYFLLLAFIGGIILNFTPCVLPVLTMRAMSLVKQSQDAPKLVLTNSLMYGIGILVSFLILASIIIGIKLTGESVGWGFQYQNPVFVIFLYSILFLFSLSLFDIFLLQAPGASLATQASSKKGYLGSFFMGIFAVLLGTPCMAPFLGVAIGFALLQPPLVILYIFIMVAIGFAFPFLMIGFFPKSIKILPKPGNWMVTFKELLAFVLLGFAIDQLNTLYKLTSGYFVINTLFFTLALTFAAWLYGKYVTPMFKKSTQWIMTIIAILAIVLSAMFFLKDYDKEVYTLSAQDDYWGKFSSIAVQENIALNNPVFIDFTAAWCKSCKTNERLVLNTTDIRNAFAEKGVVMLKGDFTKKDDEILEWLQRYNRAGVPLYLLFVPGVSEPIIFPELLTKQMIFDALEQIK
jgi:thiol:disulfide interchange protein DsbD